MRHSQLHSNYHSDSMEDDYQEANQMKAIEESRSNQEELLARSAQKKYISENDFEKLMTKYAQKKCWVRKLQERNMRLEEKLKRKNQYIDELEKNRKIAESVNEINVFNSVTAPAQNQTPMVQQKQSAQQVLPSRAPIISRSLSTLQVQPNTNVLSYQFPSLIIPNNQSGQRYLCCGQYPGYYNNTHCYVYNGLHPRNHM